MADIGEGRARHPVEASRYGGRRVQRVVRGTQHGIDFEERQIVHHHLNQRRPTSLAF